ncbi:MAG: ABC transporter permease [Nocardioides sp.]|nr:ABC transporter permease [Nocardioides sp.]
MSITTPSSRAIGLTRANWRLMLRNRLTLAYGLILPLLPMLFLFSGTRGDDTIAMTSSTTVIFLLMLFPVYYNLLSMFVSRRDELVLKRLRTGEARDSELITSMAMPGVLITLVITLAAVMLGFPLGQQVPTNPILLLAVVLLGAGVFTALALWTAAWTRTAEAAQITSMPVILLASVGPMAPIFPESARRFVELTPGSAMDTLVRLSWFGYDDGSQLDFAATWGASSGPMLVLAAWVLIGWALARTYMHWEPRH